ncbi:MAG: class E sortase [Pseudolysinimonas sp.]
MTEPRGGRGAATPRRRISVIGVLGELLITSGVFVLLFLVWQLWFNDLVVGSQLHGESLEQSQVWQRDADAAAHGTPESPPVLGTPAASATFGLMIVPRWGADYYRPIAEGTGTVAVLNKGEIGHYPTSQMPGAVGNFAVAAHRTSYGKPFNQISNLSVGDHIYVETADGWYSYVFRNLEYVRPTGVGVVAPVPQADGASPTDRLLTMTSCNPLFSSSERIIAYSLFDRFYPRADGPPQEIAATVAGTA